MRTVTKKELTDRVADALKVSRSVAKEVGQRLLEMIVVELAKGNRIEFRDFGVFECRVRKPRMAQNPRTLERVPVPSKISVKFKAGRMMKDRVQKLTEAGKTPARTRPAAAAPEVLPPTP